MVSLSGIVATILGNSGRRRANPSTPELSHVGGKLEDIRRHAGTVVPQEPAGMQTFRHSA